MEEQNETTLTSLHKAGQQIAEIFAGCRMSEQEKSQVISRLLVLMRNARTDDSAMGAKLMILGALAAVGREVTLDVA
jgi:hypothetical protein